MKMIIAVDFDGVIHSYDSRWVDYDVIPDPPVSGAIDWLRELIKSGKFTVCIFSSRNVPTVSTGTKIDMNYPLHCGQVAMARYLVENGLEHEYVNEIIFPLHKPPAHLTIDDRGFCFTGEFPSIAYIENFKTWNGKSDAYEE